MEEKFILVNLHEKKSKDIATVMSNETARKILDFLTDKENISPSELSKKLDIPINTITHALKLLEQEGFIIRADHAWSEKGKKVFLYSLTKKMILIVPKGYDWKESLKKILPLALIGAALSLALRIYSYTQKTATSAESMVSEKSLALESLVTDTTQEVTVNPFTLPEQAWLYTIALTIAFILILFIIDLRRKRK